MKGCSVLNRYNFFYKVVAVLTLAIFLYVPVMGQAAYSSDYAHGKVDGQMDGKGTALWFLGGLCLGGIGVILAFVLKPKPSTAHLMGMSPEYVDGYVDGYGSKAAKKNGLYALGGMAVQLLLVAIAVASAIDRGCTFSYL